MASGEFNGFARTNQECSLLAKAIKNLLRKLYGGKGNRNWAGANGGIGSNFFSGAKGVLKESA